MAVKPWGWALLDECPYVYSRYAWLYYWKRTRGSSYEEKEKCFFFSTNKNSAEKPACCFSSLHWIREALRTATCSGVVDVLRQSFYLVLLQSKAAHSVSSPRCVVCLQCSPIDSCIAVFCRSANPVPLSLPLVLRSRQRHVEMRTAFFRKSVLVLLCIC